MSATVTTRARNLRPSLAEFEAFKRGYVKPPVGISFQSLVTNGAFNSGADFVLGAGWVIGSGVATKTPGETAGVSQDVGGKIALGRRYFCSAQVTHNGGGLAASLLGGGGADVFFTALTSGLISGAVTATMRRTEIKLNGSSTFDGTADDFALWEANPFNDKPWLRLPYGMTVDAYGWVVRDGQELMEGDFILRRGADPMQNFVEPVTPPGANTRFTVHCSEVRR